MFPTKHRPYNSIGNILLDYFPDDLVREIQKFLLPLKITDHEDLFQELLEYHPKNVDTASWATYCLICNKVSFKCRHGQPKINNEMFRRPFDQSITRYPISNSPSIPRNGDFLQPLYLNINLPDT